MESRFNAALEWIKINLGNIENIERCYSGINSDVWKIVGNDFKIGLKIYKKNNTKEIIKFSREVKFLNLLNKNNIACVPTLITSDKNKIWIIYHWIEGEKKTILSSELTKELINFLVLLKGIESSAKDAKIDEASEACFDSLDFVKNIDNRIRQIKNKSANNKNLKEIYKKLIENEVEIYNNHIKENLLSQKVNNYIKQSNRVLTQSDMGIHNTIANSEGYFFIDFEHSGWDTIIKTITDLILQPNHIIYPKEINKFLNIASPNFKIDNFRSSSFKTILQSQRLKWLLIMLNPLLNNSKIIDINNLERKLTRYLISSNDFICKYDFE